MEPVQNQNPAPPAISEPSQSIVENNTPLQPTTQNAPFETPPPAKQKRKVIPILITTAFLLLFAIIGISFAASKLSNISSTSLTLTSPTPSPLTQTPDPTVPPSYNSVIDADAYNKQFGQQRDSKRHLDLVLIGKAIYNYAAANNGNLPANFPSSPTCIGESSSCYNLYKIIVPTYLALPLKDPSIGDINDSGYKITSNTSGEGGKIKLTAIDESGQVIESNR